VRCLAAKHAELKEGGMLEGAAAAASKRRRCVYVYIYIYKRRCFIGGVVGGKRRRAAACGMTSIDSRERAF
jgi:hypothetical protein